MVAIKTNVKKFLMIDENLIKITLTPKNLHIINYDEIKSFEDNKIVVTYDNKKVIVKGNNLTTKKLLDHEILIEGVIVSIELG